MKYTRSINIILLISILFTGCSYFDRDMPAYLDYWTGVAKVGRHEITAGEYNILNEVFNISARKDCTINLLCMNPQQYKLLEPAAFGTSVQPEDSFSISSSGTCNATCTASTPNPSSVFLSLKLDDADEGKHFTVSGNIYPKNMPQLKNDAAYTFDFIQNSPPDEVVDLNNPTDKYPGTDKLYMVFDFPDQNLNRNHDISFLVECYEKDNETGILELIETATLTRKDNLEGESSNVFKYYFKKQHDNTQCDYTVTVIDSTGLKSDIRCTNPGLGVCKLPTPGSQYENGFISNEMVTIGGTEYELFEYDAASEETIEYKIENKDSTANMTVIIDGVEKTVTGVEQTGKLYPGPHTIYIKISKALCIDTVIKRNIYVKLKHSTLNFEDCESSGEKYEYNGKEYEILEYSNDDEKDIGFRLFDKNYSLVESNLNVYIDGNGPLVNSENYSSLLKAGPHHIKAVVTKNDWTEVTVEKDVYIRLKKPVISFKDYKESVKKYSKDETYEVLDYTDDTEKDISFEVLDKNYDWVDSNFEVYVDGVQKSANSGKCTETLTVGPHVIKMVVSKDNCITETVEKKVYVNLKKPCMSFSNEKISSETKTVDGISYKVFDYEDETKSIMLNVKYNYAEPENVILKLTVNGVEKIVDNGDSINIGAGTNRIELEVSNNNCDPVKITDDVFINLLKSDIVYINKANEEDSKKVVDDVEYEVIKYSYLKYDNFMFAVINPNNKLNEGCTVIKVIDDVHYTETGNSVPKPEKKELNPTKYDSETGYYYYELAHGMHKLTVTISSGGCEEIIEKKLDISIYSIRLYYSNYKKENDNRKGTLYLLPSGKFANSFGLCGKVMVNDGTVFDPNYEYTVYFDEWSCLDHDKSTGGYFNNVFSSPYDEIFVYFYNMRILNGDKLGDATCYRTLAQIKKAEDEKGNVAKYIVDREHGVEGNFSEWTFFYSNVVFSKDRILSPRFQFFVQEVK